MCNNPYEVLCLEPLLIEDNPSQTNAGDVVYKELRTVSDPTPEQRMRLVEQSGTLDFWNDPAEDGYAEEDGKPL